MTSGIAPHGLVIAPLREPLARRDAEFAKFDKAFFAQEDRFLELESSLAKATSSEANLWSRVSAL